MKKVVRVLANTNFTLDATFDNGLVKRFDFKPYLKFPVFERLRDFEYFKSVDVSFGAVHWQGGEDISPETMFIEGVEIGEEVIL